MSAVGTKILAIIEQVLQPKGDSFRVAFDVPLHENGLGFDSLDTATLSVLLEQELGKDPYSQGVFPRTVKDLVEFYETKE